MLQICHKKKKKKGLVTFPVESLKQISIFSVDCQPHPTLFPQREDVNNKKVLFFEKDNNPICVRHKKSGGHLWQHKDKNASVKHLYNQKTHWFENSSSTVSPLTEMHDLIKDSFPKGPTWDSSSYSMKRVEEARPIWKPYPISLIVQSVLEASSWGYWVMQFSPMSWA